MSRRPILTKLSAKNFLSLRAVEELELESLNVLVGPNAAGKTNLLKIFRFLGEVARVELAAAIEHVGGFERLRYQGGKAQGREIELSLSGRITAYASDQAPDEYTLSFREGGLPNKQRFIVRKERILFKRKAGVGRRITVTGDDFNVYTVGGKDDQASANLKLQKSATALGTVRRLGREYEAPSLGALADMLEGMRLIDVNVEEARSPASMDELHQLEPDARNVAAFLLYLRANYEDAFQSVEEDVRSVLPGFEHFEFVGSISDEIELQIKERHLRNPTPLSAASFGTVRSIALFAMLNDPEPPPLTCIEEIDTGLHPHALDRVVDRLREAATRSQIIVATHSPALVNRLATEELIVVERDAETGESVFFRPDPFEIEAYRDELGYELGELWFSGALGGNP